MVFGSILADREWQPGRPRAITPRKSSYHVDITRPTSYTRARCMGAMPHAGRAMQRERLVELIRARRGCFRGPQLGFAPKEPLVRSDPPISRHPWSASQDETHIS
eukprot:305842-Prymnesium_polylepis.1